MHFQLKQIYSSITSLFQLTYISGQKAFKLLSKPMQEVDYIMRVFRGSAAAAEIFLKTQN